ncbi:MAG: hypothetical protein HY864_13385 [Chloroflexi bacterium]|nr:hypothetical protein [Chloroflexota bacterium]
MITVFIALIFYIVDPMLGIILAVGLPALVALDSTGEYSHALGGIMFAVAVYFVRKVGFDQEEE